MKKEDTIEQKRETAKEYYMKIKGHAPPFLDTCPEEELDQIIDSYFKRLWCRGM